MQTAAWHQEKLNTQLSSWSQLRHDNILYAKQSWSHGGECLYPYSYVEPYPAFYRQIGAFAEKAAASLLFSELQSASEYFQGVKGIMATLEMIAQKELDLQPLTDEEVVFLSEMVYITGGSGRVARGWYPDLFYNTDGMEEDFIVADIHTQPCSSCRGPCDYIGRVLHIGVGKINLGVFLADAPVDKSHAVAYVGPVFSYYEKTTEGFERLTDAQWSSAVRLDELPPRPDWVNVYLADKNGNGYAPGRELPGIAYNDAGGRSQGLGESGSNAALVFVDINDPGIPGRPGFKGQMSKYETTNAQYAAYLNAALTYGLIHVIDGVVYAVSDVNQLKPYFDTRNDPNEHVYSQIEYRDGRFRILTRDGHSMANHPVVEVSWYGAMAFCDYYGYRLPTEWEWQAVADFDGSYTYGCGLSISLIQANHSTLSQENPLFLSDYPYTTPVGLYPAYGYGLCDMAGNVWEWTSSSSGAAKVFRGGSWNHYANDCTVSSWNSYFPYYANSNLGFRVCR